jgi:tRNA threonylcarbamoyl adenosine modification protein (Sua5/YciO/YrdC/YwlC family)
MQDDPAPVIAADAPDAVEAAAAALLAGEAIVLPTDTVYGLAVAASVPGTVARLFELKARAAGQPIALLVADVVQARSLAVELGPEVEGWMAEHWPGALTLVLRRSPTIADLDLGGAPGTVGVRCPDHDLVRALAARVGPLATTSANRSGEPTPRTAPAAAASLVGRVALVVDGGPAGDVASTVVDASFAPWRVLREGAIREDDLRRPPA